MVLTQKDQKYKNIGYLWTISSEHDVKGTRGWL